MAALRAPFATAKELRTRETRLMATPEENREIYRRYVEEVWNQGRADAADRYLAPNATAPSAPQLPPGPEGMRIIVQLFLAAFPDFHMTIEGRHCRGALRRNRNAPRYLHGDRADKSSGTV
jgi:hypothetical protein